MFLIKLVKELNQHDIPYALVGGHAMAIYGAVRGTMDVDLVLRWSLKSLQDIEIVLQSMNLVSRLPISDKDVFHFKDEYINNRNLIAWNFYNPIHPSEQVNIIITHDLAQLKTINVKYRNTKIKILSKKGLIQMKKDSGLEQDLLDVEALEKL